LGLTSSPFWIAKSFDVKFDVKFDVDNILYTAMFL
jgi:hypothetical protein